MGLVGQPCAQDSEPGSQVVKALQILGDDGAPDNSTAARRALHEGTTRTLSPALRLATGRYDPSVARRSQLGVVVPLVAVVGLGLAAAAKGIKDLVTSRLVANEALRDHDAALQALEAAQKPVHECVAAYGDQQIEAVTETIGQFADWIERNQRAVNRLGNDFVGGIDVSVPELPAMKNEVKQASGWIKGGVAGASAALAAPQAALVGVSAFATASTGTAISGLSGAAATNATLAWLGGGSLAAGGGGMAAGTAVIGLIAAAPAAFIGGITFAVIGSKQKTSATQYAAEVKIACEHIGTAINLLPRITERVTELSGILKGLVERASDAINTLEELTFDPDVHGPDFQRALQLVRAIREVVNTPVLDETTGELTEVSLKIVRKYQ